MFDIDDGLSGGANISTSSYCEAVIKQNQLVAIMNKNATFDGILQ